MKLSIVVAYRNREIERVHNFLGSLENQSVKDFELIFVDTGTELELAAQVNELVNSFSFATYVYNDSRGQEWNKCIALNIGANLAKSDFLSFTDIDLMFHSKYIESIYNKMSEEVQLYTQVFMVDESFTKYDTIFSDAITVPGELCHTSGKGIVVVSKRVFEEIGGYDEYYVDWGIEDNDFHIRLCSFGLREDWVDNQGSVYHQWHQSNANLKKYPEKWLDEMSFHYTINQSNWVRNTKHTKGLHVKFGDRLLPGLLAKNAIEHIVDVQSKGTVHTKSLYYREIWSCIQNDEINVFSIKVPKYEEPKISFLQKGMKVLVEKILQLVKSSYQVAHQELINRHEYFIPEKDILWFFRKLNKSTNSVIKDYYIQDLENHTIYTIEKK